MFDSQQLKKEVPGGVVMECYCIDSTVSALILFDFFSNERNLFDSKKYQVNIWAFFYTVLVDLLKNQGWALRKKLRSEALLRDRAFMVIVAHCALHRPAKKVAHCDCASLLVALKVCAIAKWIFFKKSLLKLFIFLVRFFE